MSITPIPATPQTTILTIAAYASNTPVTSPASGATLPVNILIAWSQFQSDGQSAVQLVGGQLSQIPAATIMLLQSDLNAVLALLTTYLTTVTDPANQSAVSGASAYVQGVYNALPPINPLQVTVPVASPNLFTLANIAYGDATQWQKIAAASNQLDPQPANGNYTITIPSLTQ